MSDVVVCIADLPDSDTEAISGCLLAMGGLYSSKLTSQVTHVIALTLESEFCVRASAKGLNVKIVLPHWIEDCLKLGKKIDEQPYLLPDPEIQLAPTDEAPPRKEKSDVEGATHPDPSRDDQEIDTPRTLEKVFKKKGVMLSNDLGISENLRGVLEGIITANGGRLAESVPKADMFICKYRDGRNYTVASRSGKHVGNLAWLYYLIQTDE